MLGYFNMLLKVPPHPSLGLDRLTYREHIKKLSCPQTQSAANREAFNHNGE
jgi:hypothetical protein